MDRNKKSQSEYSRGAKTPEEAFDRQMLSGKYMMVFIGGMFLITGVQGYVNLMPQFGAAATAIIIAFLVSAFIAAPLFWEPDASYRTIRRVRRVVYFPVNIKNFVVSKIKLIGFYGVVLWLSALAIQLLFAPILGLENLVMYQAVLALAYLFNMILYIVGGTVGAHLGE